MSPEKWFFEYWWVSPTTQLQRGPKSFYRKEHFTRGMFHYLGKFVLVQTKEGDEGRLSL